MSEKRVYAGIDIGGTKMMCTVFAENKIIGSYKQNTNVSEGRDAMIKRLKKTVEKALDDAGVTRKELLGIGVGCPGPLDKKTGTIVDAANLGFDNLPVKGSLEEDFSVPVVVENDVSVGTFGEFKEGAAKGYQHVLGIFPGTGLGGGIIIDGKLYTGASGNAGEIGHMIMQLDGPLCGCGQYGCYEALASKTALSKDAVTVTFVGKAPETYEAAGTDFSNFKSKIFKKGFIKDGDETIDRIVRRGARFLGIGMGNLVNIFNPERIVLGGGLVEKLGKPYIELAEEAMRETAMPHLLKDVTVAEALLGDDAIVIGAAALIRDEVGK
jgi:glucokinase